MVGWLLLLLNEVDVVVVVVVVVWSVEVMDILFCNPDGVEVAEPLRPMGTKFGKETFRCRLSAAAG